MKVLLSLCLKKHPHLRNLSTQIDDYMIDNNVDISTLTERTMKKLLLF